MKAELAQVHERDAAPRVQTIYDAIKQATGQPGINLIWRHIATAPDVLAWVWGTVGPAYASGIVARESLQLSAALPKRRALSEPPLADAIGAPDDCAALMEIFAFYNGANPQNLLGMRLLATMANDGPAVPSATSVAPDVNNPPRHRSQQQQPLPPLPRRDALDAATREIVDRLAHRHGNSDAGVTPSLYLHLTLFPEALAAADARLSTYVGTTEMASDKAALLRAVDAAIDRIAPTVSAAADRPPADALDPFIAIARAFTEATLPDLVLIGHHLCPPTNTDTD